MTYANNNKHRVAVVTRGDLFPPEHGAAVKITRTATSLARQGVSTAIVMTDQDHYVRTLPSGEFESHPLPFGCGQMPNLWRRVVGRVLRGLGYPPPLIRWNQVLLDPKFILRVYRIALAEQCTILQADFPQYALPALVAGRLARMPVIAVEHNVEWNRLDEIFSLPERSSNRLRYIETKLLKHVDRVVAVSTQDAALLQESGIPETNLSVIPLGVDTSALNEKKSGECFRRRFNIAPDAPVVFFHGIHSYRPNAEGIRCICEHLIPRLRKEGLHGACAIVAGKPKKGIPSHPGVIFPGFVEDLSEAMAAADVAVVPLWAGGGTRMKILEYFAGGLPVVSTQKGAEGIRLSGDEICLVEDTDLDGFVEATAALLRDESRRTELAMIGRRFSQSYDWDSIANRYVELFERLGKSDLR